MVKFMSHVFCHKSCFIKKRRKRCVVSSLGPREEDLFAQTASSPVAHPVRESLRQASVTPGEASQTSGYTLGLRNGEAVKGG